MNFPVWIVADELAFERTQDLLKSIRVTATKEEDNFLPVFTNLDMAKQFVVDSLLLCVAPVKLKAKDTLHTIMSELQERGCSYVGLDIELRKPGRFVAIQDFIDTLEPSESD